jgi:putative transposase
MAAAPTRKTFKYKLQPTPAQAAQLAATLRVCRELYNAALQERKEAWQKCLQTPEGQQTTS